ncbi:hypothetical protein VTN00DRAFT_5342 [Thermoascus crustaceus]|uniref:uncharacterized protein n=1 Tax=Thermoascus crustaceus TaxID=5088 RepID=UPI003742FE8E
MKLTEQQWDRILSNNRALHGYLYDSKLGILIKAPKRCTSHAFLPPSPTFEIRSETKATQTGAQDGGKSGTELGQELKPDLPIIPPFFVNDDAEVTVTEIQRNFQNTMTNEGFSSVAVEANAGADVFGAAVSVSTARSNEHSYANQKEESRKVDSLHVAYKFPRVVVELDPDCLKLTEECRKEAEGVVNTAMRDKFYEKYDTFLSRLKEEQRNLSQTKEKTRVAAGVNFQASGVSARSNFSKVDCSSTEEGSASLNQDLRLTWEARGGDTPLCSNPSTWASTVKDYRLWRLMEQQRVVKMESLIKDVDIVDWTHLTDLSGDTDDGKDPIKAPGSTWKPIMPSSRRWMTRRLLSSRISNGRHSRSTNRLELGCGWYL